MLIDAPAANSSSTKVWRSVAHFFAAPGRYVVRVGFRHQVDGDLLDQDNRPVSIERSVTVAAPDAISGFFGSARWIYRKGGVFVQENLNEGVRLAIALLPAVLSMVAGAKDQLLRMDLYVALFAAFLTGFGSDQIKSLLAPKPK